MHGVERDETSQLIKKLVRYALACEYSRTPIRRDGIKERVLGIHGREFKKVFAGAQKQLRAALGMEMVELPTRDRNLLTVEQKRKGVFTPWLQAASLCACRFANHFCVSQPRNPRARRSQRQTLICSFPFCPNTSESPISSPHPKSNRQMAKLHISVSTQCLLPSSHSVVAS